MPKNTDRLALLETLMRVASRESISMAAGDLGVSTATVSRRIQELEDRLGVKVFHRNTHSVTITQAGLDLLPDASQLINCWNGLSEKHCADRTIEVTLKVVAPVGFGQFELVDLIADYLRENPHVNMSWQLINGDIDFYQEGCDLWLCLGPPSDDSLIVKKIGSLGSILVASPKYEYFSVFSHPSELENLPNVALESYLRGALNVRHSTGEHYTFKPPSRFTTNNFPAMYRATLAGVGFAALPYWFIKDDLESGTLVEILPRWVFADIPMNIAYAPSRYQSSAMMDLVTFLMERIPQIDGIEK